MRENIVNSITEIKLKEDDSNIIIPIISRELKFETSKYSSKKEDIWHVTINDIKLKKTSKYLISYNCPTCNKISTISTTCFLRKVRNCRPGCFQCSVIRLNSTNYPPKEKIEKKKLTIKEFHEQSIIDFNLYPEDYKNSFLLSHLSSDDYNRLKSKIISFGNSKYKDLDNYEFWPILKVNNQMKFSSVLYDIINNSIFKTDQPIIRCDNCEKTWRAKSLESFKNDHKILCHDCKLCNKIFKIRPIKNALNNVIIYQSKLEHKFIEWCNNKNIVVTNGPNVEYFFNEKTRKYRVDFKIDKILIEIKDYHIWHKNQIASGMWDKKVEAVWKYIGENNLDKYLFITPKNWNEKINELEKLLKIIK